MKDKPSEWIAISDLMAGVMAVVMLLLVVSVLQKSYSDLSAKQKLEQAAAEAKRLEEQVKAAKFQHKDKLGEMLKGVQEVFVQQGAGSLVAFDIAAGKMTLKENVFSRGSACITKEAKSAFESVNQKISEFLLMSADAQIYVEGHTDNVPVSKPVTDFAKNCTVYDDNYTLSAARAREARNLLIGGLVGDAAKRVVVAGFGESSPVLGIDPSDARNRRVEVRFIINQNNSVSD
jgi:chemotaxis protein MotB